MYRGIKYPKTVVDRSGIQLYCFLKGNSMNLENAILDIFDDVGLKETLVKVASQLPEELKNEELPDINARNVLKDNQFALSIFTKSASKLNRFPIDSRLNTALSNIYFDLNHQKLPEGAIKIAATHIKKACSKYNLNPAYSVYKASLNDVDTNVYFEDPLGTDSSRGVRYAEKVASAHFALPGKYPLDTAENVAKASNYFDKYAYNMTLDERHLYAKNTYSRASALNVKVSKEISKYAAANYGDNSILEQSLSMRRSLLEENSPIRKEFTKVSSYKIKAQPEELAKVLYQLDKEAGLTKYYDGYLKDPYESVCGISKIANFIYNKDHIYMTEKDLVDLTKNKEKVLKNYFGDTLLKGLKSDGVEAFLALPDDSKDIIARIWNGEIQ